MNKNTLVAELIVVLQTSLNKHREPGMENKAFNLYVGNKYITPNTLLKDLDHLFPNKQDFMMIDYTEDPYF